MVNLSKRWLIHLRGGYSRPVPTSVGRTLLLIVSVLWLKYLLDSQRQPLNQKTVKWLNFHLLLLFLYKSLCCIDELYYKHDMLPSMLSHAMQCNRRIGIFASAVLHLTNQFSELYAMLLNYNNNNRSIIPIAFRVKVWSFDLIKGKHLYELFIAFFSIFQLSKNILFFLLPWNFKL